MASLTALALSKYLSKEVNESEIATNANHEVSPIWFI